MTAFVCLHCRRSPAFFLDKTFLPSFPTTFSPMSGRICCGKRFPVSADQAEGPVSGLLFLSSIAGLGTQRRANPGNKMPGYCLSSLTGLGTQRRAKPGNKLPGYCLSSLTGLGTQRRAKPGNKLPGYCLSSLTGLGTQRRANPGNKMPGYCLSSLTGLPCPLFQEKLAWRQCPGIDPPILRFRTSPCGLPRGGGQIAEENNPGYSGFGGAAVRRLG